MTPDDAKHGRFRASVRAMIIAGVLVAAHVASRAARDALFLAAYSVSSLPLMLIGGAVVSATAVVACAYLLRKFGPEWVVGAICFMSSVLFFGEAWLVRDWPRLSAVVVFLHVTSLGAISISAFWSFVNEKFAPYSGKKVVARTEASATLGGVFGGIATERVAAGSSTQVILFCLAGLVFFGGVTFVALKPRRDDRQPVSSTPQAKSKVPVAELMKDSYLRKVGLLVLLVAISSTLMDYVFKAEATKVTSSGESLTRLFAIYYSVVSVLSFLVQSGAGHRLLKSFGAVGSIATLPGAVLALGGGALVFPGFWAMSLAKGVEAVLQNSLFRSGYELLYLPVSAGKKRKAKAAIDVGLDKAGDAMGAGLVMLILWIVPEPNPYLLVGIATGVSFVLLLRLRALRKKYVDILGSRLKKRPPRGPSLSRNPDSVGPVRSSPRIQLEPTGARRPPQAGLDDALLEAVRELLCAKHPEGDGPELVVPRQMMGYVITLLKESSCRKRAAHFLKARVERVCGQLIDTLLDEQEPISIRRRIPSILRHARSQRAADGLFSALQDESLEIRERSALCLSAMVDEHPHVRFEESLVFEQAMKALDRQEEEWGALSDEEGYPRSTVIGQENRRSFDRQLQHVFEILSLSLDRELLRRSLSALRSNDPHQQGTALEYLSEVLAEDLRERLWPKIKKSMKRESSERTGALPPPLSEPKVGT